MGGITAQIYTRLSIVVRSMVRKGSKAQADRLVRYVAELIEEGRLNFAMELVDKAQKREAGAKWRK